MCGYQSIHVEVPVPHLPLYSSWSRRWRWYHIINATTAGRSRHPCYDVHNVNLHGIATVHANHSHGKRAIVQYVKEFVK